MPENSVIAVYDGQGTPVLHSFSPIRVEGDKASYRDLSMSPVLVSDTATANLKESAKLRVVKVNLVRPRAVTETVNGVVNTKMADFMSVGITLNVPTTWASADIKDTRVMASNLLLDALVLAMTDQGAFVW